MRMRAVAPTPKAEGRRTPAAAPAPAAAPVAAAPKKGGTKAAVAEPLADPDAPGDDPQSQAYQDRAGSRRKGGKGARNLAVLASILVVGVAGSYLAIEHLWPKDALEVTEAQLTPIAPSLSSATRSTYQSPRAGRLRESTFTSTIAAHGGQADDGTLSDHLRRLTALREASGAPDLGILNPVVRRDGIGGDNGETIPARPPGMIDPDVEAEAEAAAPLPQDIESRREALSPDQYPPSGLERHEYLKTLRNALNRPPGSKLDLEKAYILLSMYYQPTLNPDSYRAAIQDMASELYERLAPKGADGRRKVINDGREQVRIIREFMLHGLGPFKGWEVQEYHPGLISQGTPIEDQAYLIQDTFRDGATKRNVASSTAMNLLTLVLVRKLASDVRPHSNEPKVHVPLYGVRLPDRTILRYDVDGPFKPLPIEESNADAMWTDTALPVTADTPVQPALAFDPLEYSRNIEFLRNGNHYSAGDYIRRYSISSSDVSSGTYLVTLDDKQMFASLGYEIARSEVLTRKQEGYIRARTLLEDWVLDRDDGTGVRPDGGSRVRPERPTPRGDPSMRDAYVLYAEMLLQQADYEGIKRQIDENLVLRENPERLSELRGLIAHQRARLESARAYLEDSLRFSPENARAHLYMGDIDLIMDDGSMPDRLSGTEADYLGRALRHFGMAEQLDRGTLNGQERFLLHYHRALAHKRRNNLLPALADLDRVAAINPTFALTPAFEKVRDRLRMDRAFEVLGAPSELESGELKFEAVKYLSENLALEKSHRPDLMHCAALIGRIDNIAAEWKLIRYLQALTGKDFERDSAAWTRHFRAYFEQNP